MVCLFALVLAGLSPLVWAAVLPGLFGSLINGLPGGGAQMPCCKPVKIQRCGRKISISFRKVGHTFGAYTSGYDVRTMYQCVSGVTARAPICLLDLVSTSFWSSSTWASIASSILFDCSRQGRKR